MKIQSKGAFYKRKTQKLGGNTDGEISLKQPEPGATVHCNEGKEARKSRCKQVCNRWCLVESAERKSIEKAAGEIGGSGI